MSDDRIIGKYRIPLTPTRAQAIANLVGEWPDHELSIEPPFLVVRENGVTDVSVSMRDVDAHRNGDCNSWTCGICEHEAEQERAEPPTCYDCADPIPEGEGCNCLERYCGACFVWHCASCRADMKDDLAAEAAMDR